MVSVTEVVSSLKVVTAVKEGDSMDCVVSLLAVDSAVTQWTV